MKELNLVEVEQVSGAGFIADAAGALGAGIGAVVDAAHGDESNAGQNSGRLLGQGIGRVVEAVIGINCPSACRP
ncbi:hypothetical protein J3U21_00625 [Gilliamella sp. B2776]|uniref:hypothetical protein n=1 Tax=unclassified Gilliamella TaxID=2685620 RepID=UPI00226A3545|nr:MULTISPECIES: hypothetical protein [unclassified Gilliamella]MCX8648841.1 hypothetical protein [Gilliamella sp. B2779]MCX8653283.1 hypothetical protein [Gilliamella sp. B2737]MCX8655559.1 hypothetical protein [Gilliamella sp. B2894]MCX8664309.1 hypothetical protein [Gilliamella sp. B2887]MCX8690653.1 hypothetical protein [Gilliamella sp. B2776]